MVPNQYSDILMARGNYLDTVKTHKDWTIRSEISFIFYKKEKRSETIMEQIVKYLMYSPLSFYDYVSVKKKGNFLWINKQNKQL